MTLRCAGVLPRSVLAIALLLAHATLHAQADYAREARWSAEIAPAIVVGEAVYLTLPSGRRFLALHAPADKARAGVIVVHGAGVHPDWGLVNILRTGLADQGYSTLSIQMPVLAADVSADAYRVVFPEAAQRLQAAVQFLRAAGHRQIAIVSHSVGARMSDSFLASPPRRVDAWVAIGLSGSYGNPAALTFPVLDLYGSQDFAPVLEARDARAAVLRQIRGSAQVEVSGADHFFNGRSAELVSAVRSFLDRALR